MAKESETLVEEPLALSAPLAWARAPKLCKSGPDGDDCVWYHRVWQYLRVLDVISSVRTNSDFLLDVFGGLARAGTYRRVLISAAADYSLLAHVAHAYRTERAPLQATFVDRCGTAVFLNRWYAERYGVNLTTHEADVLEFRSAEPFDLVCSHNFLSRFLPVQRSKLIAHWHTLTRVGGRVVTTQRIRPNADSQRDRYSEDEARALAAQVESAARRHPSPLAVAPTELREAVYEYALRKGAYKIRSREEITHAFTAEGFHIDRADSGGGVEERERDKPSSLAGPDTYRMRIVATRIG